MVDTVLQSSTTPSKALGVLPDGAAQAGRPGSEADLAFGDLIGFLAVAFGLAWGIVVLLLIFPEQIEATFGPLSTTNPLFFLAVYAPAIGALGLVLRAAGPSGLRRFVGRTMLWRAPAPWVLWVALGIPAVSFGAALLMGQPLDAGARLSGIGPLLGAIALMLVLGPVEELGWRGVMLPLLQRRLAPIWAGIVVGVVWAIWHLPAFMLSGTPQSGWDVLPFMMGATAVSVIMTAFFNAAGGSILWMALFHFQLNNPLWPEAQPLDMYLFVVAAAAVFWLNRHAMLQRSTAVTRVVPTTFQPTSIQRSHA